MAATSSPIPITTPAGPGWIVGRFPDGTLWVSHPKPKTDAERAAAGGRWIGGPCWFERFTLLIVDNGGDSV